MVTERKVGAGQVLGVTGLSIWSGVLGEEYLTALKGTRKTKIFKEMQDDAVIATLLDALMMPLMAAEFETVPAGETPMDIENAKFLQQSMDDMTGYTWRQHVLDMLTVLVWGWSASEVVFKKRLGQNGSKPSKYSDGKIGLHILDPRGQDTLHRWEMDEEFNVKAMVQQDPNSGRLIELPAWKLLHVTFRSRKRSPEGSSPLRSLYRAWYTRKNLEVIEAIGAERDLCGLPIIYLPYGATATDKSAAETLIRNVRQDEEAGLVIPAPPTPEKDAGNWKFELLSSPGSKQFNVRQIVQDLNKIILMRFFAQFLMLGMEQVGTQALVEGSQDFFSLALKSVQHELLEMWNMQLVPFLFSMNPQLMAGASGHPTVDWGDPGSKDVQKAIIAATGLINAQLLTPEKELEDYFRAMMGLPDRPAGIGEGPRSAQPQSPFGPQFMNYEWYQQPGGGWMVKPKQAKKFSGARFEADLGGAMLAIAIPEDVASSIVVPSGEPMKQLHITLCYFPDEVDQQQIIQLAGEAVSGLEPIVVALQGTGTFPEKDGQRPFYAKVVSKSLMEVRKKIVSVLDDAGIEYSKDYEFTPHVTLMYLAEGEAVPEVKIDTQFTVDRIHAAFGDAWTAIPMAYLAEFSGTSEGAKKGWDAWGRGRSDVSSGYMGAMKNKYPDETPTAVISRPIAEASGEPQSSVDYVIQTWKGTSAGNSTEALKLQIAAKEEFGLGDETTSYLSEHSDNFGRAAGEDRSDKKKILRAMYDKTQASLKENGIEELTLYRGQSFARRDPPDWATTKPEAIKVSTNALSSFTSDEPLAEYFAWGHGTVFQVKVPASKVLSTGYTGVGFVGQEEFVVLGGDYDANVKYVGGK